MARILLVDDEASILNVLSTLLRKQGYETVSSSGGEEARRLVRDESFDLMLTDIKMEPVSGLQLLDELRAAHPETPAILLTGFGSVKTAMAAMKGGAFDYITKPFKVDELLLTVQRALEYRQMLLENLGLKAQLQARYTLENVVANSPNMRKACEIVQRVAPTDAPVLLIGESGVGKETLAKALHAHSPRREKPFMSVNCGALPEPLLESELFGGPGGGPVAPRRPGGQIEAARGGTLYLQEIGALPLTLQSRLLQAFQSSAIRLAGAAGAAADARIVASTHEPLTAAIDRKAFREDLFYRISVIPIFVAPLRERREDILPLVSLFLRRERPQGPLPALDSEVQRILVNYDWPGNVRELENAIRHALAFCREERLRPEDLPSGIMERAAKYPTPPAEIESSRGRSLKAFLREREKEYVRMVIEKMGGDKAKAAQALRISLATLYRKLPDAEE